MKILLLHFSQEDKKNIKDVLSKTSFGDANYYDSSNFEEAQNASNWNEIEIIICFGDPRDYIKQKSFNDPKISIPFLFITKNEIDEGPHPSIFSNFPNYLPLKEVTSFVLEKCMFNTIEKHKIKNRLNEIQKVKKELEFKEEKFRTLFENSAIGLYEVDADGKFILANQIFLKILGLNDSSDLQEFNAFQSGISTNGTRQKLKNLLSRNGNIDNFEDEWLKADKTKITVKENIRAKKDTNGDIMYYQGVVEDITERKKVELELVKSKKEAEKSDRLKSEFLTQISHEIRTPVNTLLNFKTLIKEDLCDSLSEDLRDSFKHMDKAGNRIIRTIDLLVKMSELHTDNYEPEFKENNLFELLDELLLFYKPIAKEKNLDLQFIKGISSANIVFDMLTMHDVFSNLIDNAIKFTESGSVKIYVKNSLMDKITVTVIDTGIGISKEYIESIFSPFSQETSGYTRKFDGNGLGLALVKEYCQLNNSEIFVSSEKNCGSNFTVIFK
jgi:PAS domain S-box-containing protein